MSGLSPAEQERRRDHFRARLVEDLEFNRFCALRVMQWTPEQVRFVLPWNLTLTSSGGFVHGGVIGALVDVAGTGAVMAGHDFDHGDRLVTVSMSLQFLSGASEQALEATARCSRRGRTLSYADVVVTAEGSSTPLATGHAAYQVSGQRQGLPWSRQS